MPDETRYQKGLAHRAKVFGHEGEERRRLFEQASPDFARFVTEDIYGGLYEREGIDPKMREAIILAVLCARGMGREFGHHVHAAMNLGMTKREVQELIMVCASYAGAPHAVAATHASLEAFKQRGV